MSKETRGTVLITGASAGIGRELATCFAEAGHPLVLVARRRDLLVDLANEFERSHGTVSTVYAMDLLEDDAPKRLFEIVSKEGLEVDILVNNAGLLELGAFERIPLEAHQRLIQLNIATLTALTQLFLPGMIERRSGRLLNVASLSAFQPVPTLAVYGATKAFVLSLTEALSEELRGTGVTATALCPGFTSTDMFARAEESEDVAVPTFLLSRAKDVARQGFEACLEGEVVVVPGLVNRLHSRTVGNYPRWLVRRVAGLFGQRQLRR